MSKKDDKAFNAADEAQVEERGKKKESERDQQLNDLRHILASPQGRRFYWRKLSDCGVFKTSFTGNSTTFFNEGMRNVGLGMMTDLMDADPQAYITMMNESKEK